MKYTPGETMTALGLVAVAFLALSLSTLRGANAQGEWRPGTVRLSVPMQGVKLPFTANLAAYEEPGRAGKDKVLTRLVEALNDSGVSGVVNSEPVTIFAPNNAAFARAPKKWLEPDQKQALKAVLQDHVVAGRYTYPELLQKARASGGDLAIKTLSGGTLHVRTAGSGNSLFLEGGRDRASNGVRRSRIALNPNRVVTGKNGTAFVMDYFVMPVFPQRID